VGLASLEQLLLTSRVRSRLMRSTARLLYEGHIFNAARSLRQAAAVLYLNDYVDAAVTCERLEAYLLDEMDASTKSRRPLAATPPSLRVGALSPPSSGPCNRSEST